MMTERLRSGWEHPFRDFLVRSILRRYAHSGVGLPAPGPNWARIGWRSESCRELLINVCDAWGIPVGELAMKAGIEQSTLSSFIMGVSQLSDKQTEAVMLSLHEMIGKKSR